MPIAQTWAEELIAEWLHLKGYLVETGLPAGTPSSGGRYEADVVGVKILENKLEIIHVEVGTLSKGKDSIVSLQKKFSGQYCESISKFFKIKFNFNGSTNYQKLYIATYCTKPVINAARSFNVTVIPLNEFIFSDILPTISEWKKNPPHSPSTRGSYITLPQSYWLLQFLDYMFAYKLLKLSNQ